MRQKRFRGIDGLSAGAVLGALILLATAALGQNTTSPFAGNAPDQPQTSRELRISAPINEKLGAVKQVAAMATRSATVGTAVSALAQAIGSELPSGVTLRVAEGTPSFVRVGAVDLPAPGRLDGAEDVDPQQAQELKEMVDPEQLRELARPEVAPASEKWFVNYPIDFQGLPVAHFSNVTTIASTSGDIYYIRKTNLPQSLDASQPTVESSEARQAVESDTSSWAGRVELSAPKLEVWAENGAGQLCWMIEARNDDQTAPMARRYWVAATGDGQVVFWESLIHFTHHGQVTGTIWTEGGDGATGNSPMASLVVTRSSGGSATTNEHGRYAFPSGGGAATVTARLDGPNSKIDNKAGTETVKAKAGTPSNPIDLHFDASGELELAQTTAFYWTNMAYELAKGVLDQSNPAKGLPNLPTNVNISGQCNAFWNGSSINFYKKGGACPNMAFSGVVLHEYGHGVDDRNGGIQNGGYSEGFGDALAVLGTKQSCVGRNFTGPGTCLRDANDKIMWPPAPGDGVHAQGRRYAGFSWELILQLQNTYAKPEAFKIAAQLILASAAANPTSIPDAVTLSFIADDDDGDLTNGTPHFKELAAAADSRQIPRPASPTTKQRRLGFAWAHNPTMASYTPSNTYSSNSSGGAIQVTRSGQGDYSVRFDDLGGNGAAGGHVQVTAYGSTSDVCKVYWWSSGGKDFTANIRCFTATGAPVDTRYNVLVLWP